MQCVLLSLLVFTSRFFAPLALEATLYPSGESSLDGQNPRIVRRQPKVEEAESQPSLIDQAGDPGPPGPPGPMGAIIGPHGMPGPHGPLGPTGDPGLEGPMGANGSGVLGNVGPVGPRGAPGPNGIDGHSGHMGPWGPPGMAGEMPREIGEWETALDSYDHIVTALASHSESVHTMMDAKKDLMQDNMVDLKVRLAQVANGTVSLGMLSKIMVAELQGTAIEGEHSAFDAAHMVAISNADLREAQKLQGVAIDEQIKAKECENCEKNQFVFTDPSTWKHFFTTVKKVFG